MTVLHTIPFCILFLAFSNAQFHSHWDTAPMAHNSLPVKIVEVAIGGQIVELILTEIIRACHSPHSFELPQYRYCSYNYSLDSLTRALDRNCVLATNGGFFNTKTGDCLGNLVSEGSVISTGQDCKANFGSVNGNFIIGYINKTTLKTHKFDNLIAGVGWLVREGKQFINQSLQHENIGIHFAKFHAPRLAIGYNSAGELMIIEVNGLESIDAGVSLWELADIAIRHGAVNAINLDGGGSVTVVYHDKVLNTCSDKCAGGTNDPYTCPLSPGRCERAVTSITCITRGKSSD